MTQTVKHYRRKVIIGDKVFHRFSDAGCFRGQAIGCCNNQLVIRIFASDGLNNCILLHLPSNKHFGNRCWKKYLTDAGKGFRLLQNQLRFVSLPLFRKCVDYILRFQRFHGLLTDTLQFLIDVDGRFVFHHTFFGNINAVPSQTKQFTNSE